MENYLRIGLGIIFTILIFAFVIWVLPYILIGAIILILIGWVYFKFIRKYINKKEKTEAYTYTFTKEEHKSEADIQDDGPVIDVNFEEVKEDE
ncbi:hypothetical protein [Clostridium sp.]|uniref:hypothetical protein n=1 Tax=Clostridium sp. TaxID=1506 RepID=UPI002609AFFC